MPSLILPRRFTQQPQYAVDIDTGNSITKGLVSVVNAGNPSYDLAKKRIVTIGTAVGLGASSHGREYAGTGSGSGLDISISSGLSEFVAQDSDVTFFALARFVQDGTRQVLIGDWDGGGGNESFYLEYTGGGAFQAIHIGATGISVSTSVFTSGVYPVVHTWSKTNGISLWAGRTKTSASSSANSRSRTGSDLKWLSAGGYSGLLWKGGLALGAIWNRTLLDSEIYSLLNNPWQIFKRVPQRLYFDVSTSGVTGSGTLTTQAVTLAGAGTVEHKGTGALTSPVATLAGAGSLVHVGTGTLATSKATLSGSGTLVHIGTGDLTTPAVTIDGDGTIPVAGVITGYGTITTPAVTLAGEGKVIHKAVGDLSTSPVTLDGAGKLTHTGTGDLTTPAVEIDGYDVAPVVPEVVPQRGGGGVSPYKKRKIILIDRVEDIEDLIEQVEEVVKEEPKIKPLLRKAKKQRPQKIENTVDNAQLWIDYYQQLAESLRDKERADEMRQALQRGADMLNAVIERQETMRIMQIARRKQDEEMLFLLMAA